MPRHFDLGSPAVGWWLNAFAVVGVVSVAGTLLWGVVRSVHASWAVAVTYAAGMGVGTFAVTSIHYGSMVRGWPWGLVGAGLGAIGGIADETGGMQ